MIQPSDPRPIISGDQVLGSACGHCGHRSAWRPPRCERCRGTSTPAAFGPGGTVWSSATVHLQVGHRSPPFTLAYVDLAGVDLADTDQADGPRVLARLQPDVELPVGALVRIVGTDEGDLVVSPVVEPVAEHVGTGQVDHG